MVIRWIDSICPLPSPLESRCRTLSIHTADEEERISVSRRTQSLGDKWFPLLRSIHIDDGDARGLYDNTKLAVVVRLLFVYPIRSRRTLGLVHALRACRHRVAIESEEIYKPRWMVFKPHPSSSHNGTSAGIFVFAPLLAASTHFTGLTTLYSLFLASNPYSLKIRDII